MRPASKKTRHITDDGRVQRLCDLLSRLGFTKERCGYANYRMGWSAFYNLSRTKNRKIYESGAMGVQLDWRITEEGGMITQVQTWRV